MSEAWVHHLPFHRKFLTEMNWGKCIRGNVVEEMYQRKCIRGNVSKQCRGALDTERGLTGEALGNSLSNRRLLACAIVALGKITLGLSNAPLDAPVSLTCGGQPDFSGY